MDPLWLQNYPAGVPATVDPGAYASVAQLIEQSLQKNADQPFSVCMDRWMHYRDLDQLCAAIGVHDEKQGEAIKLFVVRSSEALDEDALLRYCSEHLTGYKRPRYIEFRDALPKTNVGKILRRALRTPQ